MQPLLLLFLPLLIQGFTISQDAGSILRRNNGQRIVGGSTARADQFPFMAAITSTIDSLSYFCAGCIIDNSWILTGAQCIVNASQLRVQVGSHSLNGTDPNRVTVATSTFYTHPQYHPGTLQHDVGLIKLRLPIEFNAYVGAIRMPNNIVTNEEIVTAIGWGQEGDQNDDLSSELHYVELVTITNDQCKLNYGDQVTDEMLCAIGPVNEGICTGDSGGPLIQYLNGNERNPVHAAVATFVSGQGCESTLPSGFTRTYQYIGWIKMITGLGFQ